MDTNTITDAQLRVWIKAGAPIVRAKCREKQASVAAWTFTQFVHDYKLKAFNLFTMISLKHFRF